MRGEQIDVELLFDRPTSAWVKDRIWHASQKSSVGQDGCLSLRLEAADTSELVGWILSFGAGVRVSYPDSFREMVRAAASAILEQK